MSGLIFRFSDYPRGLSDDEVRWLLDEIERTEASETAQQAAVKIEESRKRYEDVELSPGEMRELAELLDRAEEPLTDRLHSLQVALVTELFPRG
jgi:hypothetical protein